MSYRIGAARAELRFDATGVAMLGWGDPDHRVKGAKTPLYARSVVTLDPASGKRLVMVCLDICFITEALRRETMTRLKSLYSLTDDEVILSATHTHSAPGGFSSYVLYELTGNGFVREIFESYVSGILESVTNALKGMREGEIRFEAGSFSADQPVAFNRAIRAYNRNPEVEKVDRRDRHLAVDREMTLLRFDAKDGTPIAAWNWFPVHATSIHRDRFEVHSDNKGLAACFMESALEERGVQDFVAVFAQGAAGDVSPNFQFFRGLREKRGSHRDDEESCRTNAQLQTDQAFRIFDQAQRNTPVSGQIEGIFSFQDFSGTAVDTDFVGGKTGLKTGPAEVGVPQLYGTSEGRGAPLVVIWAVKVMIRICQLYNFIVDRIAGRPTRWPWTPHPSQGNKITVIESGRSMFLETGRIDSLALPDITHPTIATLKRWARSGILKQRSFTPQILPLQIVRIGALAIVAVPAEFTTIAGRRLRKLLEAELQAHGVCRVLIQGYANAYSSYVVTPEEYDVQGYEGGCTHFGRYTLPAYLTVFRKLARRMIEGKKSENLQPLVPSEGYLRAIACPKSA